MNTIKIDGIDYQLVPVDTTTKEEIKKQLFYSNGAVVYPLKDGDTYWCILGDNFTWTASTAWTDHQVDKYRLNRQRIFLTKESCYNADNVDETHTRLLAKITEIHAANNWILDWTDLDQIKYLLTWDHLYSDKAFEWRDRFNQGNPVMSEQARDYMMSDKVSDEDFKKFLKIYN